MIITQPEPYTIFCRIPYSGFAWQYRVLLISDLHIDNPKCNRSLLISHLNEAKSGGWPVMIFGDLFCAMQGRDDKRSSKSDLRPEHKVSNYLDALVDTTAEFFEPYKHLIKFISPGNHETAVLKRSETDLTARLAEKLGCKSGTFSGWVVFKFTDSTDKGVRTIPMAYHHGYGGGGQVTKDVIQTSRRAVYLPDAKIVVSGHTHDRWIFPVARARLLKSGQQIIDEQLHVKLGTYKDEYSPSNGWAIERGHPPRNLGGAWLRFTCKSYGREKAKILYSAHLT